MTSTPSDAPDPPSRLYTWFLGPFLAISIAIIVFVVVQDKTATWTGMKVGVLSGFVLLIALVIAAIYWPAKRELVLRLAAVLVVIGVGAYLADTLNKQGLNPSNWPKGRGAASVPNAILASLFFGVPALLFAIRGFGKATDAQRLAEIEQELADLEDSSKEVAGRIGPATDHQSKT